MDTPVLNSHDDAATRGIRSFGRRNGRPLKGTRRGALDHLETIGIPAAKLSRDKSLDPRSLFSSSYPEIWMEIGFGSGEHLLARMTENPHVGLIGAEPYVNGMSAFLGALDRSCQKTACRLPDQNVRVYMDDALHIILSLQDKRLNKLFILNPDPWPKARHHKRRIIRADMLDAFARVLLPGGALVLATDVEEYAAWMIEQVQAHPAFTCPYKTPADTYIPPADWPLTTRYMEKGEREGRRAHYMICPRV